MEVNKQPNSMLFARTGWCRHYKGLPVCTAGIRLIEVAEHQPGRFDALPCFAEDHCKKACTHYEAWTEEQIQSAETERQRFSRQWTKENKQVGR